MNACDSLRSQPFTAYHPARPRLVLREGKSTYILINQAAKPEPLLEVRADGGLIPASSGGKKCDYLVLRCERNILYLIELKGSDVAKACRQILETLEHPEFKQLPDADTVLHGRIVPARTPAPDLRSSDRKKLESLLKARRGSLQIKSISLTESC